MVDPVVSSRFGKRPLMDIPAMQVSSTSHQPVNSLQNPVPPLRLNSYDMDRHRPMEMIHRPYHTAPPPVAADPYFYDHYQQPREFTHYHGPEGESVRPAPHYFHPPTKFPGVCIPYNMNHAPPPPEVRHFPVHHEPPYRHRIPVQVGSRPQTFDVTCELDHGRVAHISVRESHGHFRGIPDYLRQELLATYRRYPFMEVKIRYENGDYHIYANHDKRRPERRYNERPKDRYYEEENDYHDDRSDRRYDDRSDRRYDERTDHRYDERTDHRYDEDDGMTDGIQPKPMDAPRGILRERGWNNYR